LDVRAGRVVKGVNFEGVRDVADPVALSEFYSENGADELVFYDITASIENRAIFSDILKSVASRIFIPLTVGGAINTLQDFDRVLRCGADKVSVNSGAIKNPKIIYEASRRFGNQCVVLSMDIKKVGAKYKIFSGGGKIDTDIDALDFAKMGEDGGAGELVVNSIDTDGVKKGFDIDMLNAVGDRVSIPIVASGGAGTAEDFVTLFKNAPEVDAALAASVFHFKTIDINKLKLRLLSGGIVVRI
jgi:cyclase